MSAGGYIKGMDDESAQDVERVAQAAARLNGGGYRREGSQSARVFSSDPRGVAELAKRFTPEELRSAPDPRRYVWASRVPLGRVTVLVGAGGTSKTGLAALLSVAVATGEPLFGAEVEQGHVLYLTAEDRAEDLKCHLIQALRGRSATDVGLVANFVMVADVCGTDFRLVRFDDREVVVAEQAHELAAFAKEHKVKLLVVDTLSRVNGANEDNEGLGRIVAAAELVAREAGCAVLILHHVGKAQSRDEVIDAYSGRGGSALGDNARSVLVLSQVQRANAAPVADAETLVPTGNVLRLDHAKANYSARAETIYLLREPGQHAARISQIQTHHSDDPTGDLWERIAVWLVEHKSDRPYPNKSTVEDIDRIGSRRSRLKALQWALDRGLVEEVTHPKPQGARKTYLKLREPLAVLGASVAGQEDGNGT